MIVGNAFESSVIKSISTKKLVLLYNKHCYKFGHTLLCSLSPAWMSNKPTYEKSIYSISSCLAAPLGVPQFTKARVVIFGNTVVLLKSYSDLRKT
jgi:hypothetical protein